MEDEIWIDIDGYGGKYQISNRGNARSFARGKEPVLLTPRIDAYGYAYYGLFLNGKRSPKKAHRLVAAAFIPNPLGLPQVNHKDECKTNNHVENLEWCTHLYNNRYGIKRHERLSEYAMYHGKKLRSVRQYDKSGHFITEYISSRMAERATDIPHQNIVQACRIHHYTASGYIWCYADDTERIKEIESLKAPDSSPKLF